jgi:hypothetical protein
LDGLSECIALDGDPLTDITAVRRVAFVMKGGIVHKNIVRGDGSGQAASTPAAK